MNLQVLHQEKKKSRVSKWKDITQKTLFSLVGQKVKQKNETIWSLTNKKLKIKQLKHLTLGWPNGDNQPTSLILSTQLQPTSYWEKEEILQALKCPNGGDTNFWDRMAS